MTSYEGWRAADQAIDEILASVDEAIDDPETDRIVFSSLPRLVARHDEVLSPGVRSAGVLREYSLQSYANLRYPGRAVTFEIERRMVISPDGLVEAVPVLFGGCARVEVARARDDGSIPHDDRRTASCRIR